MRLYVPILFLTLVLSAVISHAAPVTNRTLEPISISPKEQTEPIYPSETPERDWSVRFGFLGGALKENNQSVQRYTLGLRYDFLKNSLETWQAGFAVGEENFIHATLGKKFYFPLDPVTKPYYRFAVGNLMDSTDGLGSVFNLKKFQAIAAVGVDDLFHWDERLQFEIGVGYALIGPQFDMSMGISF